MISVMARRATSKAKGRTPGQKAASAAVATDMSVEAPRRGRKSKPQDAAPAELSLADVFFPGGDGTASGSTEVAQHSEPAADTSNDGANVSPDAASAKSPRGRRPKVRSVSEPEATSDADMLMPDASTEQTDDAASSDTLNTADVSEADGTLAMPIKARRGRPRKIQPTAQLPEPKAEQHVAAAGTQASAAHQPEATTPGSSEPSAARWEPTTGTVTFDWPMIEQVAATEGPNQAMAKLLLAARAEGANSRWPF